MVTTTVRGADGGVSTLTSTALSTFVQAAVVSGTATGARSISTGGVGRAEDYGVGGAVAVLVGLVGGIL